MCKTCRARKILKKILVFTSSYKNRLRYSRERAVQSLLIPTNHLHPPYRHKYRSDDHVDLVLPSRFVVVETKLLRLGQVSGDVEVLKCLHGQLLLRDARPNERFVCSRCVQQYFRRGRFLYLHELQLWKTCTFHSGTQYDI